MNRPKIAAGNWKMNKNWEEAISLATSITRVEKPGNVSTIMAVPYVYLSAVRDITKNIEGVYVAAQNCHQEDGGAYTGEISAKMLATMEIPYVIVGHSERREYFSESDELIAKKMVKIFDNGMIPIYCCGEPLSVRKSGKHISYVSKQIENSFKILTKEQLSKLVVAYEPIWAIGTGETATPDQAQEMHAALRSFIATNYGESIAANMPILYGGSVKPANAKDLFDNEDVDGGLVGGASLKREDFASIIRSF